MFSIDDIYKAGFALGALSLLIFILGHLGFASAPYLGGATVIVAFFYYLSVRSRRWATLHHSSRFSPLELAIVAVTVLLVLFILPLALTPPTVRDELIQHLAVPRLYLEHGSIFEIKFMGFSYLPQNIDLLYMVPLAFGSDIAPRLIHMGLGLLTGLLVYFYLKPVTSRSCALLGLFLYLSTPLVVNLSRMAYIDNGSALYGAMALIAVLKWKDDGFALKWLIYAGVSMGLALGAKYNNLITLLLVNFLILYLYSRGRRSFPGAVKSAVIFTVLAVAVLSPWLIRNYAWKGSPFYPLMESALKAGARGEGLHVTSEMAPVGKRFMLYGESLFDIVILPLRIFWAGADNSIRQFDGVLNPFFLAFIPLAFLGRRREGGYAKYLAIYSLLFLILTFLTVDLVTRYLAPVIPLVIILVALGFRNLVSLGRAGGVIGAGLLAALIAFNAVYIGGLYKRYSPLSYLTGAQTRNEYISARLPDYDAVLYANSNLPKDARVLMLFTGDRGYYWERDYYYADRNGVYLKNLMRRSPDGASLAEKFSSEGMTHLFLNDALIEKFLNDNFGKDGLSIAADFFNNHTTRLYSSNGFTLFALRQI